MLGHNNFDSVSDIYAPFSPTCLRRVLRLVEEIIDELDDLCPGAFTAPGWRRSARG